MGWAIIGDLDQSSLGGGRQEQTPGGRRPRQWGQKVWNTLEFGVEKEGEGEVS